MDLYIVSASQHPDVQRPLLDRIAEALEFQLYQHAAPFCQQAGVRVFALTDITGLPDRAGASPLVIYDDPDQAGVLGWHTYNPQEGRIHGTAFLRPILDNGGSLIEGPSSLSCTLSHEALEAVMDPYVNLLALMGEPGEEMLEPVEACDRVQGYSYDIGGISVSNFLGPRAFRDGPGPYDWLQKLSSPWEIAPGGYCQRYDMRTGQPSTLWGAEVPTWKQDLVLQKRGLSLSRLSHRTRRTWTTLSTPSSSASEKE
jgi:hypothetical protein